MRPCRFSNVQTARSRDVIPNSEFRVIGMQHDSLEKSESTSFERVWLHTFTVFLCGQFTGFRVKSGWIANRKQSFPVYYRIDA